MNFYTISDKYKYSSIRVKWLSNIICIYVFLNPKHKYFWIFVQKICGIGIYSDIFLVYYVASEYICEYSFGSILLFNSSLLSLLSISLLLLITPITTVTATSAGHSSYFCHFRSHSSLLHLLVILVTSVTSTGTIGGGTRVEKFMSLPCSAHS